MTNQNKIPAIEIINTSKILKYIKPFNVDLIGIADLIDFKNNLKSLPTSTEDIIKNYKYAIVIGAQYGKLGKNASGMDTSLYLEMIALNILSYIVEKEKHSGLIIHTEDEIDSKRRMGILPLKALAKAAGLGWQGRSLLIISPKYGPIHRLIAILTDMELIANKIIENKCGDCCLCIEKCPPQALTFSGFSDHPNRREEILDITKCKGDNGCNICINVCPWIKQGKGKREKGKGERRKTKVKRQKIKVGPKSEDRSRK
jgi:epoxyqueuosine reductase QueG